MKKISYGFTLLLPALLFGASTPNSADALKLSKPPKEVTKKRVTPLVEIDGVKKYKPQLKDDKSGKKILIKDFIFSGNDNIKSELLSKIVEPYKNKKLNFSDIQKVSSKITKKYRDEGFFVARAYIPAQTLTNGILEIAIIEGNYGDIKLKNNSKVDSGLIQNILNQSKNDKVINNNSLDRTLLLLNDIPGVVISKVDIKAGNKLGTSDFNVITSNTKSYDGYIVADNYGSRYTGKNRLILGADFYSPFNIGDQISVIGLLSNGGDLKNGLVSYAFPLHENGLRGKLSYSNTTYHLTNEYASLDSVGETNAYNFEISYPYIKSRNESLDIFTKIERNEIRDEIRSTDYELKKHTDVFRIGMDYTRTNTKLFDKNHNIQALAKLSYGKLTFHDESQRELDADGANTQGNFSKLEVEISSALQLNDNITLDTSFKFQKVLNNKNLDGTEDFSVGGPYGVKLYPSGELSAENGYLFNIEAKYILPQIKELNHSVGFFYDLGSTNMENKFSTFKKRTLQNLGIGHYSNYKTFFSKAQIAWKINNEHIDSEPDNNSRIIVMIGWRF